jgi:Tol biopolymer transport system component
MIPNQVMLQIINHCTSCAILVFVFCSNALGAPQVQVTSRVSVDSLGGETDWNSGGLPPVSSDDGRFVAFRSGASSLAPSDPFWTNDIFVHDRQSAATESISIATDGTWANGNSLEFDMSGDGKLVVFSSSASNLVPNDVNAIPDIFLRDRLLGVTESLSLDVFGIPAGGNRPRMSPDGRFVTFSSFANDLVFNDGNISVDVFLHDRTLGTTQIVSVDSNGSPANGSCSRSAVSNDGRFILFGSGASNLVSGDTNSEWDQFVHDRFTAQTERVNVDSTGAQSKGAALDAGQRSDISGDGRFVVFESSASTLVPGDTNLISDVFLRDRLLGTTERINVSSNGEQDNSGCCTPGLSVPRVSDDGRYVSFLSEAPNLVPGDSNSILDVFVRDRKFGITELAHVSSDGVQGEGVLPFSSNGAGPASISSDGRLVTFGSTSTNLVPGDTNGFADVFIHDRMTGGPEVDLTNVIAGQTAQLSITGGTPSGFVLLGVSLTGQGLMASPWGPLELDNPQVFFAFVFDGAGQVATSLQLPLGLAGLPLWVQGVDLTMDFPTSVWGGFVQ